MKNEPVAWNYDNGKWEVCVDGYAVWLDSDDFTHDASLQVAGDFVDLPQKFAYAEEIAKRLNNSLYTHPAETITLAELRQTDLYRKEQTRHLRELLEPKTLTNTEVIDLAGKYFNQQDWDAVGFYEAILRKAQEK